MSNKPALALFDFDGTITTRDTLFEFIMYSKGKARFFSGFMLLAPVLTLFKAGVISNSKAKQIVMATTPTRFTIADPADPFTLDIAGFDASVPSAVSEFARL